MPEVQHLCDIRVDKVTGLNPPTDPTDAVNKAYVDATSGGSGLFPFWDTNNLQDCIPLVAGELPFWLANGTQDNIPIGC